MNIPEGCKPFNLEAALAGAKTICRDGSPGPVELHLMPEWYGGLYTLLGKKSDGNVVWYLRSGNHESDHQSNPRDLFMAPVEKEITAWAVVDKDGKLHSIREQFCDAEFFDEHYPSRAPFSIVELTGKWKG